MEITGIKWDEVHHWVEKEEIEKISKNIQILYEKKILQDEESEKK